MDFTLADVAIATIVGYTLGALPIAYAAGRLAGVNIFEVGSRQAGATNVFREAGRPLGIGVFFLDSAKGLIAVLIARFMGLEGGWLLLPAIAALLGHWNSPFTRFKGGDGVSTLTGVGIGLALWATLLPYAVGGAIALGGTARLAHPSLWGALLGYATFLIITLAPFEYANSYLTPQLDPAIIIGLTLMGLAIALHSTVYHYRARSWKRAAKSGEEAGVSPPLAEKD